MTAIAGPYDDVLGTDTTPLTITITLPRREVAFIAEHMTAVGTSTVDYLGQYEDPTVDASGLARRIVRNTVGEWVKNAWERAHLESADDAKATFVVRVRRVGMRWTTGVDYCEQHAHEAAQRMREQFKVVVEPK